MRTFFALLIGKTLSFLIQTFKLGGGSAAPGLYALKIQPNLVEILIGEIPKNIIVTGTNGKTTTSRLIAHFAKNANLKVIRNHTGSNLERGIASALIQPRGFKLVNPRGWIGRDIGIWELDEATFNIIAPKIKPDMVIFLNVFRDQLDRFGEIDSVVKRWCDTLKKLPKTTKVILNGDDLNTLKLKNCFRGKSQTFGVENYKIMGESTASVKERENLDFEAKNVKLKGLSGSSFELFINHQSLIINLPLPGLYHIYDTLAAFAVASLLNLPIDQLNETLKDFSPAFGRVEKLSFGYVFLIKNPAGATQVFQTIAPLIKPDDRLLLALNDNLADGTDVSWIWDAGFEKLKVQSEKLKVVCSGTRAYDLALRLKYAGFDTKNIMVEPKLENALREAREGLKGTLFILPTYTAMLNLQGILAKSGIKENYWKES